MITACLSEWGADVARNASGPRDALDHPVGVSTVDRVAGLRPKDEVSRTALAAAGLQHPQDGDSQGHGGGLVALAHQAQDTVAAQGLGVVLDPHRRSLDARSAFMPSRKASAPWWTVRVWATWRNRRFVAVNLRQPGVDRGIEGDEAVDVGVAEEPADTMHHRDDRGVPSARTRRAGGCRALGIGVTSCGETGTPQPARRRRSEALENRPTLRREEESRYVRWRR